MLVFEDPKGTTIEVFQRPEFQHQKFATKGVVPHKLGHVAFHCEDVKKVAKFYIDVLGFRNLTGWQIFRVPALRPRSPYDQSDGYRLEPALPHRLRGAQLGPAAGGLRFPLAQRLQDIWGPGRHGISHNLFAYHRSPNGLITELFCELDLMKDEELGYLSRAPGTATIRSGRKCGRRTVRVNLWGPGPPEEMMK